MKIQLKRSSVLNNSSAKEPTADQLEYGELAVNYNTNDPVIFIKDSDNKIIRLASTSPDVIVQATAPATADYSEGQLWWNSDSTSGKLFVLYDDPADGGGTDAGGLKWIETSPTPEIPSIFPDLDDSENQAGTTDDRYLRIDPLPAGANNQVVQSTGTTTFNGLTTHGGGVKVTGGTIDRTSANGEIAYGTDPLGGTNTLQIKGANTGQWLKFYDGGLQIVGNNSRKGPAYGGLYADTAYQSDNTGCTTFADRCNYANVSESVGKTGFAAIPAGLSFAPGDTGDYIGFLGNAPEDTTSGKNLCYNFYARGTAPNFFAGDTYIGGSVSRNTRELWESTLTEEQKEELAAGTLVVPANVAIPSDGEFARQWWYDQQDEETQALIDAGELEYPEHFAAATFTDTFALGVTTNINLLSNGTAQAKFLQTKRGLSVWNSEFRGDDLAQRTDQPFYGIYYRNFMTAINSGGYESIRADSRGAVSLSKGTYDRTDYDQTPGGFGNLSYSVLVPDSVSTVGKTGYRAVIKAYGDIDTISGFGSELLVTNNASIDEFRQFSARESFLSIDTGSSVGNYVGFYSDCDGTKVTGKSYAFYASAFGNNAYNFYANGNAPNFFAGSTSFGEDEDNYGITIDGGRPSVSARRPTIKINPITANPESSGYGEITVAVSQGGIGLKASAGPKASTFIDFDAPDLTAETDGRIINYRFGRGTSSSTSEPSRLNMYKHNATEDVAVTLTSEARVGIGLVNPTFDLELINDSAAKPSSTSWNTTSDERIKEDIELADLDLCYEAIKSIPLKRYKWKEEVYKKDQVKDRHKIGWIAQDVEAIFPKAVGIFELKYNQIFEDEVIPAVAEELDEYGNLVKEAEPERIEKKLVREDVIKDCRTLNADQLYAAMYGAIQKLIDKVETLETEIATIKEG